MPHNSWIYSISHFNIIINIVYFRYLTSPHEVREHMSVEGKPLDHQLSEFHSKLAANRKRCLLDVVIGGKSRSEVKIDNVYVTPEDRRKDEDINNATKAEIVVRIEEKLLAVCDCETSERLQVKWSPMKCDNKVKKEQLIEFYQDICSEISIQEEQEAGAFVIECEED